MPCCCWRSALASFMHMCLFAYHEAQSVLRAPRGPPKATGTGEDMGRKTPLFYQGGCQSSCQSSGSHHVCLQPPWKKSGVLVYLLSCAVVVVVAVVVAVAVALAVAVAVAGA